MDTVKTIAYIYGENLYLNLTNRCPTVCRFCVKRHWKWDYRGHNLKISGEDPSGDEVWQAIESHKKEYPFKELVFCGYGECTYRLSVMIEIGRKIRRCCPKTQRRLNTTGLGNLIWGRNIAPLLRTGLDAVSVSLNTADPSQWLELHAPLNPYRKQGFESVLSFIESCVRANLQTTVTAIEQPGVNLKAVEKIAAEKGALFRARPLL